MLSTCLLQVLLLMPIFRSCLFLCLFLPSGFGFECSHPCMGTTFTTFDQNSTRGLKTSPQIRGPFAAIRAWETLPSSSERVSADFLAEGLTTRGGCCSKSSGWSWAGPSSTSTSRTNSPMASAGRPLCRAQKLLQDLAELVMLQSQTDAMSEWRQ